MEHPLYKDVFTLSKNPTFPFAGIPISASNVDNHVVIDAPPRCQKPCNVPRLLHTTWAFWLQTQPEYVQHLFGPDGPKIEIPSSIPRMLEVATDGSWCPF